MAKREPYQGYYNYNVWNVMLWLDGERDIYELKWKAFKDYYNKKITRKNFMQKINQVGRMAHMKSDIKRQKLSKKEISELRREILAQYKEQAKYWRGY